MPQAPGTYELHVEQTLVRFSNFDDGLNHKTPNGNYPYHLPAHVSKKLGEDVHALLVHYSWLTKWSIDHNRKLWNVVPKHHYMWHLAQEAQDLSPGMTWCYANEDFVGKLSTIGLSCRHAMAAAYRSRSLCEKWILGIVLRLHHSALD